MDIKWKNYSHSITTKIIMFTIAVICFTGVLTTLAGVKDIRGGYLEMIFEDEYLLSREHKTQNMIVLGNLSRLIGDYKNEEEIISGNSISEEELRNETHHLYWDFERHSKHYNPQLSYKENQDKFEEIYADEIAKTKERLIKDDLNEYKFLLKEIESHKGLIYYATDGENVFTNSSETQKQYFKSFPAYGILDGDERVITPYDPQANNDYWSNTFYKEEQNNVVYFAFTEGFLNNHEEEWKQNKTVMTKAFYRAIVFLIGVLLSVIYLIWVIGRSSFGDQVIQRNLVDRLYNDVKAVLFLLFIMWGELMIFDLYNFPKIMMAVAAAYATLGLILFLSFVKHLKNRTLLRHTLVYTVLYKIFKFLKDVYDSGSVAVKVVIIIVGYPLIVASTFFMFPVTLGVAAWLAFKKVKEFNAIKEGVERVKNGEIHYTIEVSGKGEFGKLANNINSITDGLKNAMDNELKSERLKTELITNVSHDIRTPLTSIITYVDLFKKEDDPEKAKGYIEILDQKSQRLKLLTDDLFEATKASSGNIPVDLKRIDIVSLITQGLGELNDQIEDSQLNFKINHPKDKVYITADGKLLWRAIENLLSNIFKYALKGSRVYLDIEDLDNEVMLTIKNISAYELNISSEELMERFKRGDESRSSQGSGLGLSIAKSLIDIQRGRFNIEIDGDLFKAVICLPKDKNQNGQE